MWCFRVVYKKWVQKNNERQADLFLCLFRKKLLKNVASFEQVHTLHFLTNQRIFLTDTVNSPSYDEDTA